MTTTTIVRTNPLDRQKIDAYRRAASRVRQIERSLRNHHYDGRNGEATDRTLRMYMRKMEQARQGLPNIVQGWLHVEHDLALRVSRARDVGHDRPELRERLRDARRNLRMAA